MSCAYRQNSLIGKKSVQLACALAFSTAANSAFASGRPADIPVEVSFGEVGRSLAPTDESEFLTRHFQLAIFPTIQLPVSESEAYAKMLNAALIAAAASLTTKQFVVLVDRNPNVQAAFLYWGSSADYWHFIGAVPVSTGLPGKYEHFETPLGVFDHSLNSPDYRAEGTRNKNGFRGYGTKGMRIYDFGWIAAPRGWGDGALGKMRLQMHSTDPIHAEPRLGTPRSKGCVRIPAQFNTFLDRYAVLDEDYLRAIEEGKDLWVMRKDRTPTKTPGRYLVVVESVREVRPSWSPSPIPDQQEADVNTDQCAM